MNPIPARSAAVTALLLLPAFAFGRLTAFEGEALARAVPVQFGGGAVFSPVWFEFDCAVIAGLAEPEARERMRTRMDVLVESIDAYFAPLYRVCSSMTVSNAVETASARFLAVGDPSRVDAGLRVWMQRTYGMETCRSTFAEGVDAWVRAKMDGRMEDFAMPPEIESENRYSLFDIIFMRPSWRTPFSPEGDRRAGFACEGGGSVSLQYFTATANFVTYETEKWAVVRLPLRDRSWFYAAVPKEAVTLGEMRRELTYTRLRNVLTVMGAGRALQANRGPVEVWLPAFSVTSDVDVSGIMAHFGFSLGPFRSLGEDARPGLLRQRVVFRVDRGTALPAPPAGADGRMRTDDEADDDGEGMAPPVGAVRREPRVFELNRPFLFFVHHVPSDTMTVYGQFTGTEN